MPRTIIARIATIAITAASTATLLASPAFANGTTNTEKPMTFTVATADDAPVTCTARGNNPYRRASDNQAVGTGVVQCDAVVSRITVRAGLYRNGTLVSDNGETTARGVSLGIDSTNTRCVSGTYQVFVRWNVNGVTGDEARSAAVYVSC